MAMPSWGKRGVSAGEALQFWPVRHLSSGTVKPRIWPTQRPTGAPELRARSSRNTANRPAMRPRSPASSRPDRPASRCPRSRRRQRPGPRRTTPTPEQATTQQLTTKCVAAPDQPDNQRATERLSTSRSITSSAFSRRRRTNSARSSSLNAPSPPTRACRSRNPVPQGALVDAEIPGHPRDRLTGLPNDPHRPPAEVPIELPPSLHHRRPP